MITFYDSEGNVPLHSAVHGGDIRAVQLCINSGAKISTQQHDLSTPVHLACSQVNIYIIKNSIVLNLFLYNCNKRLYMNVNNLFSFRTFRVH